jgi:hypothetical protein
MTSRQQQLLSLPKAFAVVPFRNTSKEDKQGVAHAASASQKGRAS